MKARRLESFGEVMRVEVTGGALWWKWDRKAFLLRHYETWHWSDTGEPIGQCDEANIAIDRMERSERSAARLREYRRAAMAHFERRFAEQRAAEGPPLDFEMTVQEMAL